MTETQPPDPRDTWESIAPAWERYRDRAFEGFRGVSEWLVEQIDPQAGDTILELAAGPGETGFLAAERLGSGGRLISTDVAPTMVEAARRGAAARGLDNVECRVMDAQQVDLPDSSVDGVICRLGFMLMPEPARAFDEARRVLEEGGRFAYGVMGPPDRNPWMGLLVMALVQNGHAPMGDPFGAGGPFSLSDSERNREMLTAAGFSDLQIESVGGSMRFDSIDEYWTLQTSLSGPVPALVASLDAAEIAAVRATLEPTLEPFGSPGAFELPTSAVAVAATA